MKNINHFILVLLVFTATSCGEDLLDIQPSGSLSTDAAIQTLEDMEAVLVGAYAQMQNSDYYGRYFILVPDVMTDDVKQNSSANRAKEWAEFSGTSIDFISEEIWTELYEAINRANTVINADLEIPTILQDQANQILGEAYALRGLAHFDVCRIYAQHYGFSGGGSHPGVPIVTSFDPDAEPNRASVGEVYNAVVADFTQATSLLNENRGSQYFSKEAVQALLARVYFYQEDYGQAENFANEVIASDEVSLTPNESYLDTWAATGASPDAILDVVMTMDDNNGADALGRMYINEGYGDYLPSQDLLDILDTTDLRSQLFKFDETLGGGMFGDLRVNKFPSTTGEDNTPVVRLAEVYLIRAEARARNGNEAGAIEDLMTIRRRAWPTAPDITATGDELVEEIITERRRELAFEGHRLWDLMRLKRGVVRNDCTAPICDISYPNDRFILPIPVQEMDANPSITQNPGY